MPSKIELEEETQKSLIKIGDPLDFSLWDEVIQRKGDQKGTQKNYPHRTN